MGACAAATCQGKKARSSLGKSSDQPMTILRNVNRQPRQDDLDSSMDEYVDRLSSKGSHLMAGRIPDSDLALAKIGNHFIKEELIDQLSNKKQRSKALKASRMEKWKQMITYGLDNQCAGKVFVTKP